MKKWMKDKNGKSIGTCHNNPLHDTKLYGFKYHNVEFAHVESNIVAEKTFAQVKSEGSP